MVCRRCFAAVLLGGVAGACAPLTPPAGPGPAPVAATGAPAVAVREHVSGRFIALIGPRAQHDRPYLGTPDTNFFCLRSFIDRQSGDARHQLYVAASYDRERDWDAAHDAAGQPLTFIPISRYEIACDGPGKCSYAEEFAATIPEGELRGNPRGLAVSFVDRAGDAETIDVSGEQIAAQLAAVQTHKSDPRLPAVPAAAAQPAAHQP